MDKSFEDFLVFNLKTLGNLIDNVNDHTHIRFVMVSSAEFLVTSRKSPPIVS